MILKIKYKPNEDFDFKEKNNVIHRFLSKSLYNGKRKEKYSFKIEDRRKYLKNKEYILQVKIMKKEDFENLIELCKNNKLEYTLIDPEIKNGLFIKDLNYEIQSIQLYNWGIKEEKLDRIDYLEKYGIPFLKELIEYQVFGYLDEEIKKNIKSLSITKHKKNYYQFIDKLILSPKKAIKLKDNHINTYDVYVILKDDKWSRYIGREMVNNFSIGTKNSYGCGFVEYKEM